MSDQEDDERLVAEEENFKTALHYTVGKLSEKAAEDRTERELFRFPDQPSQAMPAIFTKPFIAALTDVTWNMLEHWANDLEAFAKHAKRSVVNADDVRLLARRSPSLAGLLEKTLEMQTERAEDVLEGTEPQPKKTKVSTVMNVDGAGPSTAREIDEDEPIIESVDDSRSSTFSKGDGRIEDDDLDNIMMLIDDEELNPKKKGGKGSFGDNQGARKITLHISDDEPSTSGLQQQQDQPSTSKANEDEDDEWPAFQMPAAFTNRTITKETIEQRRRSAGNRFSLAAFDDRWWEDPEEETNVSHSQFLKSPPRKQWK